MWPWSNAGLGTSDAAPDPSPVDCDPSSTRWSAGGVSNASGEVKIQTLGMYDGAAVGKYKVTVYKMVTEGSSQDTIDSPSSSSVVDSYMVVDLKYQSPETTPLEVEVTSSQLTMEPIDVGTPIKLKQKSLD